MAGTFTNDLDINLLAKVLSDVLSRGDKDITVTLVKKDEKKENEK